MSIKTAFITSVAVFATLSGARAADAIVAAGPEPVEYVRVCDAYGTGYFYIPGTETCLSIAGYIRTEERYGRDLVNTSDWSSWARAQVTFTTKSETEYGTLAGVLTLRQEAESASVVESTLDEGYIEIEGFRAGMFYSWWDDDASGETDVLSSNATHHNSVRYQYESGGFKAGLSVDELEDAYVTKPGEGPNNVGIAGQISYDAGALEGLLLFGYDTDTQDVAVRAIGYAEIGPGKLGLYGVWTSGVNYYYEASKWTVGAQYEYRPTDKLTIIPGAQYFDRIDVDPDGNGVSDHFSGGHAWTAGLTVDYDIVKDFATRVSVQYRDEQDGPDQVYGFLRLQRTF